MLTLRSLFSSTLLVLMTATVAFATEDIQGYRLDGSTWLLGRHPDKSSMKGFKEVDSFLEGIDAYLDLSRDIQFSGNEVEATVGLFMSNGKVAAIVIQVDPEDKSFKSLKKYFRERRGDNEPIFST